MDIKRIKQIAKEQGIDLAVQRLVCLPWELKKYDGSIKKYQRRGGGVTYVVVIKQKEFKISKSFNSEADADKYIRERGSPDQK